MNDDTTNQNDDIQQKLDDMTGIAKRALADLQNYKKRAEEERFQLLNLGKITLISELLPVVDNFKRAFTAIPEELRTNDWIQGISHIESQFLNIIKNAGLEEIPSIGQKFDPNLHEIISTAEGEKDTIIEEIEKGYTFAGRVIKPSKVIVGRAEAPA